MSMNQDPVNKRKLSVDELNEQLYYSKEESGHRPRRTIHNRDLELSRDFPEDDLEKWRQHHKEEKLPTSFYRKVFYGVFFFFLVTAIVAFLSVYQGKKTVSGDRISLEILARPFMDGGENLEVQVRIQNYNEQPLEIPDLLISYPKDSRNKEELTFMRRSLEDIPLDGQSIEEFDITLFGQEGEVREIKATLEYRIPGSTAIFLKETTHEVIIRSTPSVFTVEAPTEVVRNQPFTLNISTSSNANTVITDSLVTVTYPRGFEFISANPEPDILNNTWSIPFLKDQPEVITVTGRLSAFEGQAQSFRLNFGSRKETNQSEIETVYNALVHTVEVITPFINTSLLVNGERTPTLTIKGGEEVSGELTFTNTLSGVLRDVVISLGIDGSLYTPQGIRAQNGFFNSNTNTITWDKGTLSSLETLQAGETVTVSFTLPTQELIGRTGSLIEPTLNLSVDVAGSETNGRRREAQKVTEVTVLANSDIQFDTELAYGTGPFQNFGPMPPVVNTETSYTLNLAISNSSNEVRDAELSFFLPNYVRYEEVMAPSLERSKVRYNPQTREITWNIGDLRAGLGVNESQGKTLSLQLLVTPSLSQVGSPVTITSDITLSGFDTFTDTRLNFRKAAVKNILTNQQEQGASGSVSS